MGFGQKKVVKFPIVRCSHGQTLANVMKPEFIAHSCTIHLN